MAIEGRAPVDMIGAKVEGVSGHRSPMTSDRDRRRVAATRCQLLLERLSTRSRIVMSPMQHNFGMDWFIIAGENEHIVLDTGSRSSPLDRA
jgi:hypothetical protein